MIRAVPIAVLKPMIGATEAVSKTLLGIQNTIDPVKKLQMEDKLSEFIQYFYTKFFNYNIYNLGTNEYH